MNNQHKVYLVGIIFLISFFISYSIFFPAVIEPTPEQILIESEADWDNYPELISGTGSENDPYVIDGFEKVGNQPDGLIVIKHTTSHFIIQNCILENTGGSGIYLEDVQNGLIMDNTIENCADDGIRIGYQDIVDWTNNLIIRNNTIRNNQDSGIALINAIWSWNTNPYPSVSGISIQVGGGGGGNAIMQNILIENNTIYQNTNGIYIHGLQVNLVIQFNEIYDNIDYGIDIYQSYHNGGNKIQFNDIYDNYDGLFANMMWNYQIIGNLFDNDHFGVRGAYASIVCSYNSYYWNSFYDGYWGDAFPEYVSFDDGDVGNWWYDYTGFDIDNDGIGDSPYNFSTISHDYSDLYPIFSQTKPLRFNLTSDADIPDSDGSFWLNWTTSLYAKSYRIYQYHKYISEINSSLTFIAETTQKGYYLSKTIGRYYFIVLAINNNENTTSNCIEIIVGNYPDAFSLTANASIPDYDGNYIVNWSNSLYADNYTLYEYDNPITEINGSLTIITNEITEINWTFSNKPSGRFYYIVEAGNKIGSTLSNCIEVLVGHLPMPFNLSTTANNPEPYGNYYLNWSISQYAINYSIYESNQSITELNNTILLAKGLTNTSYIFANKTNDHYYYVILAANEYGNISSNIIDFEITRYPDSFILETDADEPDSDGTYYLNWSISLFADNYTLYEYDKPITEINGSLTVLDTVVNPYAYWIFGNSFGRYYYIVEAENQYGSTLSNLIVVNVGDKPNLFYLYSDATEPDTDGIYTLYWYSSPNADNYTLYEYDDTNDLVSELFFTVSDLELQITFRDQGDYDYWVNAENEYGITTSNFVNVSVRLPPQAFSLSTDAGHPDKDGEFILEWSESKYAFAYQLFMIDNASLTLLYFGIDKNYTIEDLKEGIYCFLVVSANDVGQQFSNTICISVDFSEETEEEPPTWTWAGLTLTEWILILSGSGMFFAVVIGLIYIARKK